jgi:hypothetical protein
MKLADVRRDIEYRRKQILRQRKEIHALEQAGVSTQSAEELLGKMVWKVEQLRIERARLKLEGKVCYAGTNKVIRGAQRRAG